MNNRRMNCLREMVTALILVTCSGVWAADDTGGLTLKVQGDAKQGYGVVILNNGKPIAMHNGGGEFSAIFANGDRSLTLRQDDWRAASWTGDERQVILRGQIQSRDFETVIDVQVQYDVLSPQIVRKKIRLYQPDAYLLYYQVSNRLVPTEPPQKLWSFDQADCQGGPLREYFPAAGFRTKAGWTVGLLTDAGFRNGWSRIIQRINRVAGPSTMVATRETPDVNLYKVATREECSAGQYYVQQTFGELLVQGEESQSGKSVALPPTESWWATGGDVAIQKPDGQMVITGQHRRMNFSGMVIPVAVAPLHTYRVSFEYRSPHALGTRFWDVKDDKSTCGDLGLFEDNLAASPDKWRKFEGQVYVPSLKGNGGALVIGPGYNQDDQPVRIELRNIVVEQRPSQLEPYHRLEMGQPQEKTVFIFADNGVKDTLREYRLASQLHFADALNFRGGPTEKIVWADTMSLCWQAEPHVARAMCAPSIFYSAAGEMYLRDSFYSMSGLHNRELNEGLFNSWGDNQGNDGSIGTLIPANVGQRERKSNDSTPQWLMWALKNRQRFGTQLPMDKIRKAAEYCLNTYGKDRDGVCWAEFVMGQDDVISYPKGTKDICNNQGVWAVTLRVIKELAIPGISETISEEHIRKAEDAYRNYYDPALNRMTSVRGETNAISFDAIWPEFLSLWLFNHKILSDEMMCNQLDRMPVMLPNAAAPHPEEGGTVRPILMGMQEQSPGWKYFTEKFHPMSSDDFASSYSDHRKDGVYYNGGSWMQIEICGYVAGKLHGWKRADKAIANRLWAEINTAPDFPTSQEYLATVPGNPEFGGHRVFAWNAFVLSALELAGLRTPDMDPDYKK